MTNYEPSGTRIIEIPEKELGIILKKYFEVDDIKRLVKIPRWIFTVLLFEIMTIAVFGADAFVHYKAHLMFAIIFIIWFVWDTLRSMSIRQKAILEKAEIMIAFLAYQKKPICSGTIPPYGIVEISAQFDLSKKSEDL